MLKSVAIFSSGANERTIRVINHLIGEFCRKDIRIYLFDRTGEFSPCDRGQGVIRFRDADSLSVKPDLILSVGGDGTFLETMMHVKGMQVPVAGINTGRLGFLANISEDDLLGSLEMIYNGDYEIIERSF